jgi:hypothetical protein
MASGKEDATGEEISSGKREKRMQEEMSLHTEVIDDVVLLIEQIRRMGLPAILDEVFKGHWVGER